MPAIFSKPNTILYVRRSGLIIAGKQIKPARLSFPPGVVHNLEVVNYSKFLRGCQAFFDDQHVRGKRILMVLDPSLVHEKQLEPDSKAIIQNQFDDFVAAMPYNPGKRVCVSLQGTNTVEFFATNHELYDNLLQALDAAGASKIVAITPAAAYHLAPDVKLASAIEFFINDTAVRGQANFASLQPL